MNKNAPAIVGTVELSNIGEEFLSEMSPGSLPLSNRIGYCTIEVWPNEGQIPHFHIITKNDIKWECCIEIYRAKYFSHGSKQCTLTKKQLKILDTWLRQESKIPTFHKNTNWEVVAGFWHGQENPINNIPTGIPKQPDYTKTV